MAKFKFQLDPLKRYRERKLLVARKDLAVVEAEMARIAGARRETEAGLSESIDLSRPGTATTAALMALYSNISQGSVEALKALDVEMRRVSDDLERHRSWVAQLAKELKAVEKLEERKRLVFDLEEKRAEKRKNDSWVAERWSRREKNS